MTTTAISSSMVNELKLAAIDAWMRGQSPKFLGQFFIKDGSYCQIGGGVSILVDRPTSGESGGGSGTQSQTTSIPGYTNTQVSEVDYSAQFDAVRATVDSLLDPWLKLPDPSEISKLVEHCRTVTSRLSRNAWSDGGGNHRGAGVAIDSCLREIEVDSGDFKGLTAREFRLKFLYYIPSVIENHLSLTLTRGGAMYGQQLLWEAVRRDVVALVKKSTEAMNVIAGSGADGLEHTFEAMGMVLDGVKLFVPGGVGKAIDLGKLGLTAAKNALPEKATLSAEDYESAIEQLSSALQTLSDHVSAEESLAQKAVQNHAEVTQSPDTREGYDIDSPVLPADSIVGIDAEKLSGLANTTLPALALELNEIADLNQKCSSPDAVFRHFSIGLGSYGPSDALWQANTYIHSLIEEVAGDVLDGSVQLGLVLSDFAETEADIIHRLNDYLAGIDEVTSDRPSGSPLDSYPVVPTRPPLLPEAPISTPASPFFDFSKMMSGPASEAEQS
mgnify:FL=1